MQLHCFGIPGFQKGCLGKACKILIGLVELSLRTAYIGLDNFLSGVFSYVTYSCRETYHAPGQLDGLRIDLEGSVG